MRASNKRRQVHRRKARRGAALVEFCVCLPVVVLIVFGTIEACQMIYLKQSVTIAAYEGARTAIVPDVELGSVEVVVQQILDDRGIQNSTITVSPADIIFTPAGEYISVEVTAPVNDNAPFSSFITNNSIVSGRVEMMKEF